MAVPAFVPVLLPEDVQHAIRVRNPFTGSVHYQIKKIYLP